ncbi:MAG: DUF481 domain-containing protein [Candidatus Omnitrophica bacterium]|nr:DUF481 domain-containing protein [Candidatus Omnitrophota bacterium]
MVRKYFIIIIMAVLFQIACVLPGSADEVLLKNGDRITGSISVENDEIVMVETEAMGVISVQKAHVARIAREGEPAIAAAPLEEPKEKKESPWKREITLGYTENRGNTENNELSGSVTADRKTDEDEINLKGSAYYSSANKTMDSQKWAGLGRYARSLAESKWFYFGKLEADHDRFANIDYRLIPSAGMGYWFKDTDDLRLMAEGSLGLEHTEYRDDTEKSDECIGVLRGLLEKKLFGKATFSQDVSLYPSFGDFGEYRLHSETALTNPISDSLSLRVSLIDDYNSDAPAGKKKNDLQIVSSLVYAF